MKGRVSIAILVLLWLLASGRSCDHAEQEDTGFGHQRISSVTDSLTEVFGADSLTPETLRAFEELARVRMGDFFDYLAILHDTTAAGPFRAKADEMIGRMVFSHRAVLLLRDSKDSETEQISIDRLRSPDPLKPEILAKGKISGIRVTRPLLREADSIYTGELDFGLQPGNAGGIPEKLRPASGSMTFVVLKHRKNFGTDTLRLWDVFLGDPR